MRRTPHRANGYLVTRKSGLVILPTISLLALVVYLWAAHSVLRKWSIPADTGRRVRCVSWRRTHTCSPFGERDWAWDRDCAATVSKDSGYCQCTGGRITKLCVDSATCGSVLMGFAALKTMLWTYRLPCGRHTSFTCAAECDKLNDQLEVALSLPHNVSCQGQGSTLQQTTASKQVPTWRGNVKNLDAQAAVLWGQVTKAVQASGYNLVAPPGARGATADWVRDGIHMQREDIMRAQTQWRTFLRESPAYPTEGFAGRGIAIMAGGLTYMVPAWVNIHMLRRTGCTLPVEMFFPAKEFPTEALEEALAQAGVVCRPLPDLDLPPANATDMETDLSGFTMKVAALLLSRFQEVIFLDSDNVAIADPEMLFDCSGYQQTGALLWPDYWRSSAAPDLQLILDVPSLADNTFESGQMVFDKKRVWKGLLLAAFFNMQSNLYYELFSNYMGKGDKESFGHALRAARLHYHLLPTPVGSLGIIRQICSWDQRYCWKQFAGNTMMQHETNGGVMFLHTNLSPKWSLEIPADFSHYNRRWQIMQPGNVTFLTAAQGLQRDLEHEVYQILVKLRCAPFFASYVATLKSADRMGSEGVMPLGLKAFNSIGGWSGSFHPVNNGIDFRQAFRWGLQGPYLRFTPITALDQFQYFKNTWAKAKLGRLHSFIDCCLFWR